MPVTAGHRGDSPVLRRIRVSRLGVGRARPRPVLVLADKARPERYGPGRTSYQRCRRWAADGTWARLKAQVVVLAELDDAIDGDAEVDAPAARHWGAPA